MRSIDIGPRSRRAAWLILLIAIMAIGGIMSLKVTKPTQAGQVDSLPLSSQARQVALIQATLPHARVQPALLVYSKSGGAPLSEGELSQIEGSLPRLAEVVASTAPHSASEVLGPIRLSTDGRVAVGSISVSTQPSDNVVKDRVTALREAAKAAAPAGVSIDVTGGPGFTTDIGNVFSGADSNLLMATVLVVAILLLITYRSPLLWLVPLLVVGLADQVSATLASLIAPHLGIRLDDASTGIAQVLVFGAGTDYALLLIARYRDQLRHSEDRVAAMREAVARTAEAIIASGATVTLALATLLLASLAGTRALGLAGLIGILTAMAFSLLVLPAALVVCGRGIFWPMVPRAGDESHHDGRLFARIGAGVARRPRSVAAISIALLLLVSLLGIGSRVGLSQTQIFRSTPESVVGQRILATAFPAGSSSPVIVIADSSRAEEVASTISSTPGVASISTTASTTRWVEYSVTLEAAPLSRAAYASIDQLRAELGSLPGAHAIVGGDDATQLDTSRAVRHDVRLIVPLILLIVLVVLLLLLRALVAPILLVGTVLATYFASLGISWWLFQHLFGYPALDTGVRLYAFLFLVALGVDYNIFLTARAREETERIGTRDGMLAALRSTGGVITSAGILLAAVFAVLGVLPLISLTQVGTIVCVGVLLDTLLVRTVLVPALGILLGDRFWWPWHPPAALPSVEVDDEQSAPISA